MPEVKTDEESENCIRIQLTGKAVNLYFFLCRLCSLETTTTTASFITAAIICCQCAVRGATGGRSCGATMLGTDNKIYAQEIEHNSFDFMCGKIVQLSLNADTEAIRRLTISSNQSNMQSAVAQITTRLRSIKMHFCTTD